MARVGLAKGAKYFQFFSEEYFLGKRFFLFTPPLTAQLRDAGERLTTTKSKKPYPQGSYFNFSVRCT